VQQKIEDELTKLETADMPTLRAQWLKFFGLDPPKGLSAKLIRRAIGYDLQVKAYGDLKPATCRALRKVLSGIKGNERNSQNDIAPGTRLVREWHGKTHVVDVTGDGFAWNRQSYPSLSAIAREITGTRWNGRKFFGVASQVSPI